MLHTLSEEAPEDYNEISFVCLRPDGCLELPSTLGIVCRSVSNRLDGFEGFHFHQFSSYFDKQNLVPTPWEKLVEKNCKDEA